VNHYLGVKIISGLVFLCVITTTSALADHVEDVIKAQMKARQIPGMAIAIIHDGKIVREQGFGYWDEGHRDPVTPATMFQAASVSKPVAALGALHLVEQGKISLDENINDKLRSWKIPENRFTKDHPVTLRMILSHSGGLTVEGFGRGYSVDAPTPSLLQILDGKSPAYSAPVRVDQIPGSQWRYSGGGYLVMQQMIIDVTGKPFAEYMDGAVLTPLAMSSSTFAQPLPESFQERTATGFSGSPPTALSGRWRVHPELAAGGLWTTAGDLARFYIAIQHSLAGTSNPVISQSMTRQMLTKQSDDHGLGFFLGEDPCRFAHNGSNVGFDSVTIALCDQGEGAVFLMNANTDLEVLKNILVDAVIVQYHWPGYPNSRWKGPTLSR
jgi:CubicO group peptidase (beta-lactamase class C family)